MEMINERIATLKAEKLEMQQDYLSLSDEEQNVIAMANMRISMELEFLDKLNKALVISSVCPNCNGELDNPYHPYCCLTCKNDAQTDL